MIKMKRFFPLLIANCSLLVCHSQNITLDLNKNWQFRKHGTTKWYKAEVPGTVHTDLLANKLIPDPFYRDNENKVQWVEKAVWEYKTVFDVSAELLLQKKNIEIEFDGLDTYADVFLNGIRIMHADNMFRQWTADIKQLLKLKNNILQVRFAPASELAKLSKSAEKISYPDNERIYVRKAQYQFGWDWGPRLVTCGIWKEVRLSGWDEPFVDSGKKLKIPRRDIKLITQKDSIGESFYFTVNGKPTFVKGTNWIPSGNFLPRAKKLQRYDYLIKAAKEANINMLRVWGGGVYEDDLFYDLCDKYGIMVWQDFMFAGALYPADSAFLKNVEEEVRYQVKRLRNHPCIALWCGNNEIEEAWFNWGWQKQFNYSAADSLKLWNDYKKIFHQLIPNILKELDPGRPYWPSSPSLGWGRDSAYKKGDVHYWGVWWGKEPVEKYNEKFGRFMSEYGMQGMPDMKTIKQFSLSQDWDTTSAVMKTHQKHPFGYYNIKYYINQKFKTPKTFEDLVYVSQLMQADAITTAIDAHRRNKPITMGTMFWQWNDCWPVVSWSAVDYYGRKKALFYEVKRSYEDLVILPWMEENILKAKVVTDSFMTVDDKSGVAIVKDFNGKEIGIVPWLFSSEPETLEKAYWLILLDGPFHGGQRIKPADNFIEFRVKSTYGLCRSSVVLLKDPKELNLQKPKINWTFSNNTLQIASDKFAYAVFIDVPDGVELEDNYFHLLPNEKKVVKFTSTIPIETIKKKIKIKSLVDTY